MSTVCGREIYSQPEAWAGALSVVRQRQEAIRQIMAKSPVVFCGCGTSYYLALAAARVYEAVVGVPALAVPGSELFVVADEVLGPNHRGVLVALSRSGESSETVKAARFYKERGFGSVVALTAREDSALGRVGDLTVTLPWADDQSVVMTCSFTTLLLTAWAMAAVVAGDQDLMAELDKLPGLAPEALASGALLAAELGQDLRYDQFIFLGMGSYLGLAYEGMLKLKEMTQVPAEAYSPLEFRHGPISIVKPGTAVVLLCREQGAEYSGALVADIKRCGGRVVAVGHPTANLEADHTLPLGDGLSDRSRGLLYLPFLQLLGLRRALALGRNPDQPANLNRVVLI